MDAETRVVNNLVEYNKRRFVTIGIGNVHKFFFVEVFLV